MLRRTIVFFLAVSGIAVVPARAQNVPGCGPANVKFDVSLAKASDSIPAPGAGNAILVFVQNSWDKNPEGTPLTRFGIDGTWVGAAQGDAYFSVPVAPGEHHLCSNWQSKFGKIGDPRGTAALHFIAEPGKTYFVGARYLFQAGLVDFEMLDSDEAKLLMASSYSATSHLKK
jgi:hypothetical protein